MDWVKDKIKESPKNFRWSDFGGAYEDHNWDGDVNPLYQAWMQIANSYNTVMEGGVPDSRVTALEAATGTGKTYFLARLVYWFLDCFPDSLVITSAPVQTQLKIGLWSELSRLMPHIKKHHPNSNLYTLRLLMNDQSAALRSPSLHNTFENFYDGWLAMAYIAGIGADEQSAVKARGFHRKYMLIIMEECSGMDWSVVNAFQNTCTGSFNYIFAVGNPSSKSDALHQLAEQPNVANFRVSGYDHPNIVLKEEIIPGAVTVPSIEDRKSVYGIGSRLYDAMVRGICPEQAFNALIHSEWLDYAFNRDGVEPDGSFNAMGVDVAASENGDKGAVAKGSGNELNYLKEFPCPNATYLGENIMQNRDELAAAQIPDYDIPCMYDHNILTECIGIDAVGVGVATVEAFLNKGLQVTALSGGQWAEVIPLDRQENPMWRFANLRSQMYWELREDLRRGTLSINLSDKATYFALRKELLAINFDSNNGSLAIESKQDIKKRLAGKSPNMADAVVYWNWVRKRYRPLGGEELPVFGGGFY